MNQEQKRWMDEHAHDPWLSALVAFQEAFDVTTEQTVELWREWLEEAT